TAGMSVEDLSEAAFRSAELERASGRIDAALADLRTINAASWRVPAELAILQCRVLRAPRDRGSEPLRQLLVDLGHFASAPSVPDEARASAFVLEGSLRAEVIDDAALGDAALDDRKLASEVARLREFPKRYPTSDALT